LAFEEKISLRERKKMRQVRIALNSFVINTGAGSRGPVIL
jgi:hypothetical protein